MATRVKDLGASKAKYARNAQGASGEYAVNAQASGDRWSTNTAAAADTFHQAVSAGGVKERFRRGVARAGAAKFAKSIETKGSTRYSQGVGLAEGDWEAGFSPFAATIASLTLPRRRPRGDPANISIVSAVTNALHAKRLAQLGSGSASA